MTISCFKDMGGTGTKCMIRSYRSIRFVRTVRVSDITLYNSNIVYGKEKDKNTTVITYLNTM